MSDTDPVPAGTAGRPTDPLGPDAPYAWTARVRWVAPRESAVYARTHAFTVGPSASFAPGDPHPSAVEYLLGALGADLTNGFHTLAGRAGIPVDALECVLSGSLGNALVFLGVIGETGNPGITRIAGTLYVSADTEEARLHEVWATTLQRSPIYNTLKAAVVLALELRVML